MIKDRRYHALKTYIESGAIKNFSEIFDIVPKSTIVKDSGINFTRLTNKTNYPEKFTIKDLMIIAQLVGINSRKLYDLIDK